MGPDFVLYTQVDQLSSAQRASSLTAQGIALGIQSCKETPKPQAGRPCSLAKQVRTVPLGLGRLAESAPRTTSGAITGLARWADPEFLIRVSTTVLTAARMTGSRRSPLRLPGNNTKLVATFDASLISNVDSCPVRRMLIRSVFVPSRGFRHCCRNRQLC